LQTNTAGIVTKATVILRHGVSGFLMALQHRQVHSVQFMIYTLEVQMINIH